MSKSTRRESGPHVHIWDVGPLIYRWTNPAGMTGWQIGGSTREIYTGPVECDCGQAAILLDGKLESVVFKRGMYVDRTNGDMWAQKSRTGEAWVWINGYTFSRVPKENLEFDQELPDWY